MATHNPVELVPYDPQWPQVFQRIRGRLLALLPQALSIDHIGSTSIPGMIAKPLIDIDIVLPGLVHIEDATRVLLADSFEPRGNRYDDEVWAFLSRGSVPAERVYLCPEGNGTHRNRLAFRDYLIAHPQAAADYAALKRRLAAEFRMDGDRYTAHKREFVDAIVARALAGDG
ncbi:GrpB family protein [Rhizobium leguminosarum]|uniref:GrpB family protein n=1 Tax=Rhizobium leguminosarum TaxID=384 RepID=A0AAJ1EH59_RHILE|nr:GrpB family protein [Rhizobium leguminosarum]MBY5537282.1 GrpB family protein [Rhizobium leguminosarum]MBY5538653.1 GrpB family protein [Rhizobium leguminosarum]MBY5588220.1 GrpB family protein [Rhizobium leguminosarum]MBY5598205.1 GrpB family protein [Rhizobium leguminosarum]MBY5603866.1 GrpB family protein [Rhizobium leguminosarum]